MSSFRTIPTLELREFTGGDESARRRFIDALGRGLTEFGFIKLEGHGVDPTLVSRGYEAFQSFFALDEVIKDKYSGVEGGARGYTPFVQAAIKACATMDDPPVASAESLRALSTVFAIYEAAETGKTIRIQS